MESIPHEVLSSFDTGHTLGHRCLSCGDSWGEQLPPNLHLLKY